MIGRPVRVNRVARLMGSVNHGRANGRGKS